MADFDRNQLSVSIARANLFRVASTGRMSVFTALGALFTTVPALAVNNDIQAVDAFTDVTTTGSVHEITSKKMSGSSAVNVFNKFVVGTNHTANLKVPDNADKLVNIVRGSDAPSVHGILNSYKNGSLGGDVVFASSAGFVVGSTGIVNVGKLSIKTPSDSEISDLIDGNAIDSTELNDLLNNSYSVSPSGTVRIQGKINTTKGLDINANTIQIDSSGIVIAGKTYGATAVGSASAVNVNDLTIPTELSVAGGTVTLKASSTANDAINISGDLYADGGFTISANDIALNSGSMLDARNSDDSLRGDVTLAASQTSSVGLGSAAAKTSIDISGSVYAANVNAKAESKASTSFYEEPGVAMGMATVGVFAGASFYLMDADAEATINVNGTANIQASGNVSLASESHALTNASSITLGSALPASLAAVYATSDATSTTHVKTGATIQVGGDLNVTAHNEAYVSAMAADFVAADNNAIVLAAAVGESDVNAKAKIDSGVTLDANNLVIAAENQNDYYVSASAWGLTNTRYGIAVAVGDFDTNATAELGSGIGTDQDKTGSVSVIALDRTINQRVHSTVAVGSSIFMRTIGSKVVGGLSAMQNGVNSFTSRFLPGGQSVPTDSSGKVSFKGGLAFSLNLSDHDAYSYIGTNKSGQTDAPIIKATGNVLVVSQTDLGTDNQAVAGGSRNGALGGDQGGYRTSAESAVTSPNSQANGANQTPASETSLALALNFAINDSDAIAEVGKYVQLEGVNLGVVAAQHMPIVSTYDQWDSFGSVVGKFNGMAGLQNNLLTSMANAGASAEEEAYGGSVDVVWNDLDTKAWIGDDAKITTTGTGSWTSSWTQKGNSELKGLFGIGNTRPFHNITHNFTFDNSVEVRAYNLMESVNLAGNMGALGILAGGGTNKSGKSVGGSITYVQQSGSAVAGIGEATVNADGHVGVYAHTDERHFLITPSSGVGKGVGFNGVLGILNSEVLTHASLHKNAGLIADNVVIDADHGFGNWAAAGAFNWSDQSATGLSIAINIFQGDTKAFIGDNSSEYNKVKFQGDSNNTSKPEPSNPTAPSPTKGIIANSVMVRSRASGTNGSLAVAGAMTTEPTGEPGVGAKFENWFNGLSSKVSSNYTGASGNSSSSSVGQASGSGSNGSGDSGSSSASVSQAQMGMAGAGSFTVSVNNIDAKAIIDGAKISGHSNGSGFNDVDVNVQALEKVISASASGSAALSMLGALSPTNQTTIAGAISYQISFNDTLAWIKDTTITYADDVNVQALHGGELTAVALGLAVTRPSPTTATSTTGALSISGAQIYDGTSARIQDSSIFSNNGSNNDLEVSAYNNSYIGAGGGTLYAGGKQGAGLAITFAEINDPSAIVGNANPDGNNVLSTAYNEDVYSGAATEALIDFSGSTRNTLSNFDNIDVSARSLNRIGIGAAGIGYTDMTQGNFGFQGSFAIGSIGADTKALIKGADISGTSVVNVNATGEKDGTLDNILKNLGSSSVNSSYDFSGEGAMDNTKVHTSEDGSGSTYSYSTEGKRIIAVAGVVQAGKNNLGISYAHADVKSETKARIEDTNINQSDNTGASVNVNARDNSLFYSVAIGVGGSKGQFSGVGSVAVNRLNNKILAEVGDWNGSDKGTINASDLSVVAQNDMDMINVAGSVAVTGSTGLAAGLAVALNLVGTDEHSTKARVSNTTLKVDDGLTVKAYSGTSNNHNLLVGNAISVAAALQGGLAFAGAIGVNEVKQTIEAGIKDTGTNRSSNASSTSGGDMTVRGQDFTDSVATAWMGAGSGQGSATGVATATNSVKSDVTAEILGDSSTRGSTTLKAKNAIVEAERRNWLLTIDAGVAASKQISFAPSIGTGIIKGDVTARIAQDAKVEAWNNVVVNAEASSINLVGSGALGIGIDGGAGALALSTAVEYGKTQAYIDDAGVIAKGLGTNFSASSGKLTSQSALPDLSSSGEGQSTAVSMGQLTTGFGAYSMDVGTELASGLIVTATAKQKQRAITVGGSGSKNVAITANITTTSVDSETNAYIRNSDINQSTAVTSEADVLVRSSNHNFGLTVSAGGSVTAGGESGLAVIGGFATNRESKDTNAYIESSNINADAVKIDAEASKVAQAVAAGFAVAAGSTSGIGGAASIVITEQNGSTHSRLRGGVVTANSLAVNAETRQEANVAAGSAGIGTSIGVGAGLAVNLVGGDTKATIGKKDGDNNDNTTTTINVNDVDVDASRLESVYSYTFGAGIGASSTGVAAMINTTEITGETRAGIYGKYHNSDWTTKVRGKDGTSKATTVNVRSQDILDGNHAAAGLGVGASVGVGAVANVLLGRSQTYGEIVGSEVKAATVEVDADTLREADLISVSGAGGQYSAAISIGLVLMGQGDTTTDDGTNAENEWGDSRTLANNALAEDYNSYNPHLDSTDTSNMGGGGSISTSSSSSSSAYTDPGNRLKLKGESVTAASISGGVIEASTLHVSSDAQLHTYQGIGAAQGSAVGVAGGIGVTRLYDMSIATVDADVTADTIGIGSLVRNKSNSEAAGEMKNFVIGAGGTAIGVSYSDVRSKHRVVAGLSQAVSTDTTNDAGTLAVSAKDATEIRIGDTGSDVSSSPEDGTMNIQVGAGAVGVSIGIAEKDSDVDVWLGTYDDNGTTTTSDDKLSVVDGFSIQTVDAIVVGKVRSTAFSAAGGLLGGVQGVVTDARDYSNADAVVSGRIGSGSGSLVVKALAVPETFARAYGVTVAGGASLGGSFSYAKANTAANAIISNHTQLSDNGAVIVEAQTGKSHNDYVSASAAAFSASGALLAGISGAEAVATNNSDTTAKVGDYVQLPIGDLRVKANNQSRQISDADGYFVGAVSAGLTFSTAQSQTSARVLFGKDPIGPGSRTGDIILLANSIDENQGFSTAGGGGVISGSATVSNAWTKDSNNKEAASVEVADWSTGYTSVPVGAGKVEMQANHQTWFFAGADSINASVVGGSGARSDVEVDLDTSVDLGSNVSFYADEIDISATNNVDQLGNAWYSSFEHSVKAGAGGAINGSAALSDIDISHLGATVDIGSNAVLKIDPLADALDAPHSLMDYHIQFDASTSFNLSDAVVLKVGGALQGAGAESNINVDTVNTVNIGSGARLLNPVGQIEIGAYSRGFAVADASSTIWAAAGVAGGVSKVDINNKNKINIYDNVTMDSFQSTKILSGRSADYITENYLSAVARTNVYNWTAIPIPAAKKADADITVNNDIYFGNNVNVSSVRDILLEADRGQTYAKGDGVEKNPYLELFSSETSFGSSNANKGTSKIIFNGTSNLEAGSRFQQSVTVADDGTITLGTGTEAVAYNYGSFSSRASLQSYINELKAEKTRLENETGGVTNGEGGVGGDGGSSSGGGSTVANSADNPARITQIDEELAFLEPLLQTLPEATNDAIYIGGLYAAGGDVNLKADVIEVQSGSPTVTANGDPIITITNNSNKSLILGDMFIPNFGGGGSVLVTGTVANNMPAGLTVTEGNNGSGSHINIQHKPSVTTGADVILQGDLSNLGGIITVNVEKGNLIQTGAVEAKQMALSVPSGIYLLNNSWASPSYGFDAKSLAGFTSQWKPATPDQLVMYYVNSRYASEMSSKGEESFNEWWYGNNYYGNNTVKDGHLRVYLNWGFNNGAECKSGGDCEIFRFDNNAGGNSRGNGNWGFNQIKNLQNNLVKTATYQQVKDAGYGDRGGYALQAQVVAVNAYRIDINGTIRAGNFNEWSAEVGNNFDSAIAQYAAATGLSAGSIIRLSPGQTLSWREVNPDYGKNFDFRRHITRTVDPQLSLINGNDAGITISYEVGSGKITLDDVNASGNGFVSLRGRLMSTGADGKILVDDGRGSIDVINRSASELVINDLNAGSQSTGVIRITDLNYVSGSGLNFSEWYVHEPGQSIQKYVTSASATSYSSASGSTVGYLDGGKQTYMYQPKKGQLYYFVQREEVERSINWKRTKEGYIDGWFSTYQPLGNWYYDNDNPNTAEWNIAWDGFTTCGSVGSVSCNSDGSVSTYLTHVMDDRYKSQTWLYPYTTSYSNYYGSDFTKIKWNIYVPYYIAMQSTTYVKADHPIKFQFIGADTGSINVQSRTGVTVTGNVNNSSGITRIGINRTLGSSGVLRDNGNILMLDSGVINSAKTYLDAVGSVGSDQQAINLITDHVSAVASGGVVNLDITAASGDVAIEKVHASSTLNINADKGLTPWGNGTHLKGDAINITSRFGGIGDVSSNKVMNLSSSGLVTLKATGDIALNQSIGNLTVNTIESDAGDIWITLGNGHLVNGIGQSRYTDEELAYQTSVWDRLNLKSDEAGRGTVKAYENHVSSQYHNYWLIKQRLDDDSQANFTIKADYLDAFKVRYKAHQDTLNGSNLDVNTITVAEVTAALETEYRAIDQWLTQEKAAGKLASNYSLGVGYDSSYRFTVADNSSLYNKLTEGARWSDSQLEISISAAALQPVTDGYISSRAANISGNNVKLDINSGRVGKDLSDMVFTINRNSPTLTDTQKAALLEAGPGDLTITDSSSAVSVRVKQQDPIKINASGDISLAATQQIYVESDQGLILKKVATAGDVRLAASGDIISGSGNSTTIAANNLNLSTRSGYIGTEADPIRLDIETALRSVAAPSDIWLNHVGGDLQLGAIGAGGLLSLTNNGHIKNWSANGDNIHVLADGAVITAKSGSTHYNIGDSSRGLNIQLSNGYLELIGAGAWVNTDSASSVNLGIVDLTGHFGFKAATGVNLKDNLSAATMAMDVVGDLVAEKALAINSAGAASVTAASLELQKASVSGSSVYLEADSGNASLGAVTGNSGSVSLLSTGNMSLYGPVQAQQALLVDAQRLVMEAGSSLTTDDKATITTVGDMALNVVAAKGDVRLSGGNISLNANITSQSSVDIDAINQLTLADNRSISATGHIDVDAGALAMAVGTQLSAGQGLTIDTTKAGMVLEAIAADSVYLNSADDIALNQSVVSGGITTIRATGVVNQAAGKTVQSAGGVRLIAAGYNMGPGALVDTNGDLAVQTIGSQNLTLLDITGFTMLLSNTGNIFFNEMARLNGAVDITANSGEVKLAANKLIDTGAAFTSTSDSFNMFIGSTLRAADNIRIETAGSMTLHNLTSAKGINLISGGTFETNGAISSGTSFSLNSNDDTVFADTVTAVNDISMNAGGDFIFNGDITSEQGSIILKGQKSLYSNRRIIAGSEIDINLTNTLSLAGDQWIKAGGNGTIKVANIYMGRNALLEIVGDTLLVTSGNQTLAEISVGGGLTAQSTDGSILFSDDVIVSGDVMLNSRWSTSLAAYKDLKASGSVTIHADSIRLSSASRIEAQGILGLTASTVSMMSRSNLSSSNDLDINASRYALLNSMSSGGKVSIASDGTLTLNESVTAAEALEVQSGSIMTVKSVLNIGGDISINSGSRAKLYGDIISTTGGFSFTGRSDLFLSGSINIVGAASLTTPRRITLGVGKSITADSFAIGSDAEAGAYSFTMNEDSVINAKGVVIIHTRQDQLLSKLLSGGATDKAFVLNSDRGSIKGRNDLNIADGEKHLQVQCAGVTCTSSMSFISAATGIGDPLVVKLPWLHADSDVGDINIIANPELQEQLIKATGGNVYMTTMGSVSLDTVVNMPVVVQNDLVFSDGQAVNNEQSDVGSTSSNDGYQYSSGYQTGDWRKWAGKYSL